MDTPDWLVDFLESLTAWDVVLAIIAITAIVLFVKKGWPALLTFSRAVVHTSSVVDSLRGLPRFMEATSREMSEQSDKINVIHAEVQYNSGSTVKDAVARLELGVKGLYPKTDDLEASIVQIHKALARLEQVDADLLHEIGRTAPPEWNEQEPGVD